MKTTMTKVLTCLAILTLSRLAVTPPASAAVSSPPSGTSTPCPWLDYLTPNQPIYQKADITSPVVGRGNPGDCLLSDAAWSGGPVWCPKYNRNVTDWWSVVVPGTNDKWGFVSSCFTNP